MNKRIASIPILFVAFAALAIAAPSLCTAANPLMRAP